MKLTRNGIIIGMYILGIFALFLYSFTQVDLGLTLTRWQAFQGIQKAFQHIGYFNRPLATQVYVGIIGVLFISYIALLSRIAQEKLSRKTLWKVIIFTTVLLTFAYNAFSYDLFNYIFDARIITKYGQDPYLHKALDYPGDPMLGFMRWTHRTYPYGPVWLGISVPISFLGMQLLLPTLLGFKMLMSVSFLAAVYYIEKIIKKLSPDHALFGMAFFAFNPLVIVESLVSSHHDIVMMAITMFSLWLLVEKKYVLALVTLLISIGIKFATVFLLPVYLIVIALHMRKKRIHWDRYVELSIVLMIGAIIAATMRTNFQPWYLLFVLPFAALVSKKYYVFVPTVIMSFFASLIYVPYLYHGNWDEPIPALLEALMYGGMTLAVLLVVARFCITHTSKKK